MNTNLTGMRFGHLTVDIESPAIKSPRDNRRLGRRAWSCRCDCGRFKIVRHSDLIRLDSKRAKSCGTCKSPPNLDGHTPRDGRSRHQLYHRWKSIVDRCYNAGDKNYLRYGGRGIRVCLRWLDSSTGFWNFAKDMGELPSSDHSVERVDNDGDYSPENCKWANRLEQANNTSSNRYVNFAGVEITVSQFVRAVGVGRKLRHWLERRDFNVERTLLDFAAHLDRRR